MAGLATSTRLLRQLRQVYSHPHHHALVPLGPINLRPRSRELILIRHASSSSGDTSTTSTGRPRTLEKPSRYNPPSHPTRINRPPQLPRMYPGPSPPPSSSTTKVEKAKRYPNTFPNEGSFMHWFLTTRWVHLVITMGTLITLAIVTFHLEFHRKSPYATMLPPASHLILHPINFFSAYIQAFKLDTDRTSAITAERRQKKVDDVVKRNEYRKAHGLDTRSGFGGWSTLGDSSPTTTTTTTINTSYVDNDCGDGNGNGGGDDDDDDEAIVDGRLTPVDPPASTTVTDGSTDGSTNGTKYTRRRVFTDSEGNKRPLKMWFGIW